MSEIQQWLPISIQVITTVVAIVWAFAKLDKKQAVSETKINGKLDNLSNQISEIKDNHLKHLVEDVEKLSDKLNAHLIEHR